MNIFDYLKDEGEFIESKLKNLIASFEGESRETIFDDVKLLLDSINGFIEKQKILLFDKLAEFEPTLRTQYKAHNDQLVKMLSELENLTMVHVDEPGYKEYLASLLLRLKELDASLAEISGHLKSNAPAGRLDKINEELAELVHSPVGFNTISQEKAAGL
jgi:hypothetical protein